MRLAIDGVSGKSSALIASALTARGTFVVYAYMAGGPVTINPFELIVKRIIAKGFFMNLRTSSRRFLRHCAKLFRSSLPARSKRP